MADEYRPNSQLSKQCDQAVNQSSKKEVKAEPKESKESNEPRILRYIRIVKKYIYDISDCMNKVDSCIQKVSDIVGIITGSPVSRSNSSCREERVSYRSYYDNSRSSNRINFYDMERNLRNDIYFNSWEEASRVRSDMEGLIRCYNIASVSDLYSFVQKSCPWTYNDYGWTNFDGANIVREGNRFILVPPTEPRYLR